MLIDLLALSDMYNHASSASHSCNKSWSVDIEGANNTISSAYINIHIQYRLILHPSGQLFARVNTLSMYTANRYGDNTPPCLTTQGRQKAHEKHEYYLTHRCNNQCSKTQQFYRLCRPQKTFLVFRFLICSCNCFRWLVTCDTLVVLEVAIVI